MPTSKPGRGPEQTNTQKNLWLKPGQVPFVEHAIWQVKRLADSVVKAFYIKLVELQEYDLTTNRKWAAAYKYEAVLSC